MHGAVLNDREEEAEHDNNPLVKGELSAHACELCESNIPYREHGRPRELVNDAVALLESQE